MFNSWLPYRNQLLTFFKKIMYYLVFIYYLAITFLIVQDDIIYLYVHYKIPCPTAPFPSPSFLFLAIMKSDECCRNATIKVSRTSFWNKTVLMQDNIEDKTLSQCLRTFWNHVLSDYTFLSFWIYFLLYSCKWAALQKSWVERQSSSQSYRGFVRTKNSEFRISARDLTWRVTFTQPEDCHPECV